MRRRFKVKVFTLLVGVVGLVLLIALFLNRGLPLATAKVNNTLTKEQFIQKIKPRAEVLSEHYGVRTSVIIAQAALESDFGTNRLAVKYHNLFGTKAEAGQQSVKMTRQEQASDYTVDLASDFAVYDSWDDSMDAHMELLRQGKLGDKDLYKDIVTAGNYKMAAKAFVEQKYSQDENYAKNIRTIIEDYKLTEYDK